MENFFRMRSHRWSMTLILCSRIIHQSSFTRGDIVVSTYMPCLVHSILIFCMWYIQVLGFRISITFIFWGHVWVLGSISPTHFWMNAFSKNLVYWLFSCCSCLFFWTVTGYFIERKHPIATPGKTGFKRLTSYTLRTTTRKKPPKE